MKLLLFILLISSKSFGQQDSICKTRGHAFDVQESFLGYSRSLNGLYYPSEAWPPLNIAQEKDSIYIVDTKDSSYSMLYVKPIGSYCYRCQKTIYDKPKDIYLKTIWRKEPRIVNRGKTNTIQD